MPRNINRRLLRMFARGLMVLAGLFAPLAYGLATRFDNALLSYGASIRQLSSISSIAQDSYGFIWLGGENGLGRYDGTELKLYQANAAVPGSLPNNYIWQLGTDREGHLWVATSLGLCRHNPKTDGFEMIDILLKDPLPSPMITSSLFAEDGLYVGTTAGVSLIDLQTGRVATWTPSQVRTSDYVGRWGGEEFILLCSNPGAEGAEQLEEKVRASVHAHLFEKNSHPLLVTVSIGIALATTEETFEQTAKRADNTLYQAK